MLSSFDPSEDPGVLGAAQQKHATEKIKNNHTCIISITQLSPLLFFLLAEALYWKSGQKKISLHFHSLQGLW